MSSQFWGARMEPGGHYAIKYPGILNLNQVSLLENPKEGKTKLKVLAKGHVFVLCTLVKGAVEHQSLSHFLIAEDEAVLILDGINPVDIVGTIEYDDDDDDDSGHGHDFDMESFYASNLNGMKLLGENQGSLVETEDDDEDVLETVTGEPHYANYLSDLLGPDLPDDDDEDYEDMEDDYDESQDEHGTTAFRDVTDNTFLGGFELRHFNLAPHVPGYERIDLRQEEENMEDSLLNDNIAKGLAYALVNSGDDFQKRKGYEVLKRLTRLRKKRTLASSQ